MKLQDQFLCHYSDEISWYYDSLDRIVINGMFQVGQTPGGFRYWWRNLFGNDKNLTDKSIQAQAGNYSRKVTAYTRKYKLPLINCSPKQRKDEIAEPYIKQAESSETKGLFLVLTGIAPAPVWKVERSKKNGKIINIHRKKPWPYVKHYYFHIMDPLWGHVIIRICGYPPYGVQVILNGHEWVKNQLTSHKHIAESKDNSFIDGDPKKIQYWCNRLMADNTGKMLEEFCEKWVYSTALFFALNNHEREKSFFQYSWKLFQIEYSRNYIFHSGKVMEEIYQGLIDRNRKPMNVKNVKTIFGVRGRPHIRLRFANEPRGRRDTAFQEASQLEYDLTVFKLHWDNSTLKLYDKNACLLRGESVSHNAKKMKHKGRLTSWCEIVEDLKGKLERFINAMDLLNHGFLDKGRFDSWHKPSKTGKKRLAGIDINNSRMRLAIEALITLAAVSEKFKRSHFVKVIHDSSKGRTYKNCNASYDLRKLKGKGVIRKIPGSIKYRINFTKMLELATHLTVREKIFKPLCANGGRKIRKRKHENKLDKQYRIMTDEMIVMLQILNINAA